MTIENVRDALVGAGVLLLGVGGMTLGVMALTNDGGGNNQIRCFEDEVVVWTGEAHDECMAIDTLIATDAESVRQFLDLYFPEEG